MTAMWFEVHVLPDSLLVQCLVPTESFEQLLLLFSVTFLAIYTCLLWHC